ncbi:glycosyltransferase family 4 protein [Sphingomonas sp. TDK1]|uniref:glycosyltransferase family 4 protein n=1 Tax=Sphingomonas sp. TDK1 TaxID=453247 RepID=UPI0007D95B72|nr:glycosyltransferase family 4 protein [Sphingomonas sp. TDK1]OAN66494.1 hypothetical protein A7X12_10160 [Sphingomonas sp. TDK1]
MIRRIVILNDLAEPKGGATALALLSAHRFLQRGHPVTFITGDSGDNAQLREDGAEIVALGQNRLLSGSTLAAMRVGLYNGAAYRMVADWIRANDTPGTVYHLHGWAQILSPSIFRALQQVLDRVVLSAHDFFLACPNGSYSLLKTGEVCTLSPMSLRCIATNCDRRNYVHKLWRVTRQAIQRYFYNRRTSPPILAIHEAMRPFLMRAGIPSSAIRTLPNPVTAWTQTRIVAEENRDILFVGRLEETKGADLAAQACKMAGAKLRCIGDGVLRAALSRNPAVQLEGRQNAAGIAAIAAQARLLVMPSRYPEPYGLVAAEAAWSGLPVIAPPTAFLTGDLVAAGAGMAVEPRDTANFAATLRRIIDDDALCAQMSHAAFSGTRAIALDPDAWIDRLLDTYSERLSISSAAELHAS